LFDVQVKEEPMRSTKTIAPNPSLKLLKPVRSLPKVQEQMKQDTAIDEYRLPAFRYQGRIIAGFSATSDGCSYYPFSGTTLKTLAGDIQGYSQTKGALHFGRKKPLPTTLVRKLLKARIAEGQQRRTGEATA
jgi:uncharacterized protein YdhG (YjbR/CyaY superfamily)